VTLNFVDLSSLWLKILMIFTATIYRKLFNEIKLPRDKVPTNDFKSLTYCHTNIKYYLNFRSIHQYILKINNEIIILN